ncbi:ABC transporter substrate-binding protein [Actinocorallia sp. API 0066]|uniref:ABC transporter substrate-binding protein n=1 Tax=Actinocorallia sp. API 0066 TaxID=2896846 RepID=UPI001E5F059F|nr:ABC transporter substrate-binding protein [Actinocorallia sp. API 0066]MCD0449747.1 ABC transporter substrate-binding protein [Actinocorallia sp. API 0066]
MHRSRLTAVAAVLAGLVPLAACSGSGGGKGADPAGTAPVPVTTAVPAPTSEVASITWNIPSGEPPVLDPAASSIEPVSTVVANLCESLFTFGPGYERLPALATDLAHPDPLTYVVKLREGVRFWNGDPVTADDVLYSIQRILNPALGSAWIGWSAHLRDVRVTGAHEITIRLRKADVLVPNFLATPAFSVVQKKYAERAGKAFGTAQGGLMCTGAYKLGTWAQGQRITIERNDGWWNAETAKPKVGKVDFTFVTDPAAQAAALASGDVDGQFTAPRAAHAQLAGKGNLLFNTGLGATFLAVLKQDGALGDPAVRAALQKVIDYRGILESVYGGTAQPLRSLVPPGAWGYAPEALKAGYDALPEPAQDLDGAKKLAAGSAKAKEKIVLAYATSSEEETRIATAIGDSAAQAGLNVELRPLNPQQYGGIFSSAEARAELDAFIVTGYLDFPEPVAYYSYFTTGNFYNFAGYRNTDYDKAVAAAQGEEDPVKRAGHVVKAQAVMAADLVNIPIATQYVNVYYGSKLTGLAPSHRDVYTPWAASLGGK